jgi:hypothetical protein
MSLLEWFKDRPRNHYAHYTKGLQRYRQEHPESLKHETERIQNWISYVQSRRIVDQRNQQEQSPDDVRLASAVNDLKEAARTAFMSHPAATEYDFRKCWPYIREEILKQHALEELAANPELLSKAAKSSKAEVTEVTPLYPRLTDSKYPRN